MELGRYDPPFDEAAVRAVVERLPREWLRSRRWFGEKSQRIERISMAGCATLSDRPRVALALLDVTYEGGGSSSYVLPLLFELEGTVREAVDSTEYQRLLFDLLAGGAEQGPVRFEPFVELPAETGEPRVLPVEQSNTSIAYGREWILKMFRKLVYGPNRDLEVGRFLTTEARFAHTPQVAGAISYDGRATLGVLQRFVANQGDGWSYVLEQLASLREQAPNAPDDVYWAQDGLPDRGEALLRDLERLGHITGEMHQALASRPDLPDFAPEPCTDADARAWVDDLERQRSQALASAGNVDLPDDLRRELPAAALLERAAAAAPNAQKIQIHGDYHLGQVLKTAEGFVIIDFEGEPARSLEERRAKQPALRDVAGMLRSIDYASASAGQETDEWAREAGRRFVAGWRAGSGQRLDEDLLRLFQLSKAFYELRYELNNRPDWVHVPLRGLANLLLE